MPDTGVFEAVHNIVRSIPAGRVMSYGQVGELAGCGPRTVGWAMATAPEGVPWHRVVGADGSLRVAKRSPIAANEQRERLKAEGVKFATKTVIDMARSQFGAKESDTLRFVDQAHGAGD